MAGINIHGNSAVDDEPDDKESPDMVVEMSNLQRQDTANLNDLTKRNSRRQSQLADRQSFIGRPQGVAFSTRRQSRRASRRASQRRTSARASKRVNKPNTLGETLTTGTHLGRPSSGLTLADLKEREKNQQKAKLKKRHKIAKYLPCLRAFSFFRKPKKINYLEGAVKKADWKEKLGSQAANGGAYFWAVFLCIFPWLISWADIISNMFAIYGWLKESDVSVQGNSGSWWNFEVAGDVNWAVIAMMLAYFFFERLACGYFLMDRYYRSTKWHRRLAVVLAQAFGFLIVYETWKALFPRVSKSQEREIQNRLGQSKKGKRLPKLSFFAHQIVYLQGIFETYPVLLVQAYYIVVIQDWSWTPYSNWSVWISIVTISYGLWENDRYKFNDKLPGSDKTDWLAVLLRLLARVVEFGGRIWVLVLYGRIIYKSRGPGMGFRTVMMTVGPIPILECISFLLFLHYWNEHAVGKGRQEPLTEHFLRHGKNMIYLDEIAKAPIRLWYSHMRFLESFTVFAFGMLINIYRETSYPDEWTAEEKRLSGMEETGTFVVIYFSAVLASISLYVMFEQIKGKVNLMQQTSEHEFHQAILDRNIGQVRALVERLKTMEIRKQDKLNRTPLMCAALTTQPEAFLRIAFRIHESNIIGDLHCQMDETKQTALHLVASNMKGCNFKIYKAEVDSIRRLKGKYEELSNKRSKRETGMLSPLRRGQSIGGAEDKTFEHVSLTLSQEKEWLLIGKTAFSIVKLILFIAEDPGSRDHTGRRGMIACDENLRTMYHKAAHDGNDKAVKMLLERSLEFSQRMITHCDMMIAMNRDVKKSYEELNEYRRWAQDVALRDNKGDSPLHVAVHASMTMLPKCDRADDHDLALGKITREEEEATSGVFSPGRGATVRGTTRKRTHKSKTFFCMVCDIKLKRDNELVRRCIRPSCDHNPESCSYYVCDTCYKKAKKQQDEENRSRGTLDEDGSLFSKETVIELCKHLSLPQLLLPDQEGNTAFDVAIEKGKVKVAAEIRKAIREKLKQIKRMIDVYLEGDRERALQKVTSGMLGGSGKITSPGRIPPRDWVKILLEHPDMNLPELLEPMKTALAAKANESPSSKKSRKRNASGPKSSLQMIEIYHLDKENRNELKKCLRKAWGKDGEKNAYDDGRRDGYLHMHARNLAQGIMATMYLLQETRKKKRKHYTGNTLGGDAHRSPAVRELNEHLKGATVRHQQFGLATILEVNNETHCKVKLEYGGFATLPFREKNTMSGELEPALKLEPTEPGQIPPHMEFLDVHQRLKDMQAEFKKKHKEAKQTQGMDRARLMQGVTSGLYGTTTFGGPSALGGQYSYAGRSYYGSGPIAGARPQLGNYDSGSGGRGGMPHWDAHNHSSAPYMPKLRLHDSGSGMREIREQPSIAMGDQPGNERNRSPLTRRRFRPGIDEKVPVD